MFLFLTVIQAIVAAALVGVILMQRSEGGGLGMGGNPSGLMSARGAADFLTRATTWLAFVFVALSIALAAMAVKGGGGQQQIDTSLDRTIAPINDAGAPAGDAVPGDEGLDGEAPVDSVPDADEDPLADLTN